jgi:hypothetical protein
MRTTIRTTITKQDNSIDKLVILHGLKKTKVSKKHIEELDE